LDFGPAVVGTPSAQSQSFNFNPNPSSRSHEAAPSSSPSTLAMNPTSFNIIASTTPTTPYYPQLVLSSSHETFREVPSVPEPAKYEFYFYLFFYLILCLFFSIG
jgi:hypothetical protein